MPEPALDTSPYAARRARLMQRMQRGVAVIPPRRSGCATATRTIPFRFDSYFYYLTGFVEPDAALVLVAGEAPRSILFCRDKDPEREIWDGYRHGPLAAREAFGMDAAFAIDVLDAQLPELLADQPVLHYALPGRWLGLAGADLLRLLRTVSRGGRLRG